LIKGLDDIDAALSDRAGERLAVDPIRTFLVAGQSARGRVERHQFARFRIDQSKPWRERRTLGGIGIRARRIENDDARSSGRRGKSVAKIGNADRFDRHIGVAIDLSVDRNEVIVAVVLNPAAGKVDEGLHVRASRRRLLQKVADRRPQGLPVKVARANHVEARRLQSLSNETGVVGGGRQRCVPIRRITDDESNAGIRRRLLSLRGQRKKARGQNHNSRENRVQALRHSTPHCRRTAGASIRSRPTRIASVTSCPNRVPAAAPQSA
jgi:hypothetical protein